jgi:hypothetical protein
MLDPARHVAKNPLPQYLCGDRPSKNVLLKCIGSTHYVEKRQEYSQVTKLSYQQLVNKCIICLKLS